MAEAQNGQGVGLPPGSKIGKYEIRERLGIGGQAIVYKCYDVLLDRYVAIKQISTHLAADPRFLERFRREAQILARLGEEQPAIITIHELVEDSRGLFIVMELVEGTPLESILADTDGPIETKVALQIIWRLAGSLHAVHEADIIHRDIKPGNILICEGLKVKITDFGVAASATGQTSMLLGTTKYMAPEIFEGGQYDGRVDMYSLGFVAYEMLVGRRKFNEIFADVMRDSHSEALRWMKWHGNAKVTAPRLSEVNRDIPPALSDIIAKMIAKNPDDRFESMEVLVRTIKQTFTPRIKGAAPTPHTANISPAATQGQRASAGAGGEDLEIPRPAPPTVPLPRRSIMSLRTKIILGSFCAVCVVAIGGILGYQLSRTRAQRARAADSAYTEGISSYRNGQYESARDKFTEVKTHFVGTSQAVRASVMFHMTEAQLALIAQDWSAAKDAEDAASDRTRKVQARYGSLEKWTRSVMDEIVNFRQHRINTQIFVEAMDQAQRDLVAGNYEQARVVLNRQLANHVPTDKQENRRQAFLREVDRKEFTAQLNAAMARGDELARQGDLAGAIETYLEGKKRISSIAANVLPSADRKEITQRIAIGLETIKAEQGYQQAMAQAQVATTRGDKRARLTAILKAAEFKPSEKLDAEIRQLRSEITLDEVQILLAKGDVTRAQAIIQQAIKRDPENPILRSELERVERMGNWVEIVRHGDSDLALGNHAAALEKYEQADKLRSDPELTAKIIDCRFTLELATADTLRDDKKYDEAIAAYEEARALKPNQGATIDARQVDIVQRKNYDKELTRGDDAIARQRWREALKAYKKAKALRATEEVSERIIGARYAENLAKGKSAMEVKEYRSALAYLNLARGYIETEEVKALIEEVQKKLQER